MQATAQLFYDHVPMDHWQRPMTVDPRDSPKIVTHLTHDPLTHFHLWPILISVLVRK